MSASSSARGARSPISARRCTWSPKASRLRRSCSSSRRATASSCRSRARCSVWCTKAALRSRPTAVWCDGCRVPKRTWVRALALAALVGIPLAALADDAIRVYYDGRDCGTDAIEVEVFDQGSGDWRPHPLHPSVPVDSCQTEDAGRLWNALRWRCPAPPSDRITGWRPVQVFDADVMSSCAEDRLG